MKKTLALFIVIGVIGCLFCQLAEAKRGPAPDVDSLNYEGIKFIAPNTPQKMGYLEAWDIETNKKVWEKKVYSIFINPIMEADVQWVFISSLTIENGALVVVNERGKKYKITIPKKILRNEFQYTIESDFDKKIDELIKKYRDSNPEEDAKIAFDNNDLRYMGVGGYALMIPGVEDYDYNEVYQIPKTSDVIISDKHGKFQSMAMNYAKRYNIAMLRLRKSQKKNQPFQLTIKSDKEVYDTGEEIIISGYFKNISSEKTYIINDDNPLLWCHLIVENPDGIEFWYDAYPTEDFGPASPEDYIAILPNQSIEYFSFKAITGTLSGDEFNWYYETTVTPISVRYPFVSKGIYKVKFLYVNLTPTRKDALKGKFTSSIINIEIMEKESGITKEKVVVITDELAYKHGDTLRYEVYNGFSKDIFIMKDQHNLNFIERKNRDGSWKRFGLTMLPDEPPRPSWEPYENIAPGSKKIYDRWLGWLYKIDDYQQFDFIQGNYRLIVEYKFDEDDKKSQEVKTNEFKILTEDFYKVKQNLSPWINKAPYPYGNEDQLLVTNSYKEEWVESSEEKYPEVVRKTKEVLKEWGQNPDKYGYKGNSFDYKISVSESPNFISVVFYPIGLEGLEQHVEIRMTKKDFMIVSILHGS